MMHEKGCLVCGKELCYSEKMEQKTCYYCQEHVESNVQCVNGHFVCDQCHYLPAYDLIEHYCEKTKEENPLEMALTLMHHPEVKMHVLSIIFLSQLCYLPLFITGRKHIRKRKDSLLRHANEVRVFMGDSAGHMVCVVQRLALVFV